MGGRSAAFSARICSISRAESLAFVLAAALSTSRLRVAFSRKSAATMISTPMAVTHRESIARLGMIRL